VFALFGFWLVTKGVHDPPNCSFVGDIPGLFFVREVSLCAQTPEALPPTDSLNGAQSEESMEGVQENVS